MTRQLQPEEGSRRSPALFRASRIHLLEAVEAPLDHVALLVALAVKGRSAPARSPPPGPVGHPMARVLWPSSPVHGSRRVRCRSELPWLPLLFRVELETDVVLRMQAQHERIKATLARPDAAVPAWAATAGSDKHDTLAAPLTDHRPVLLDHLDDEEATLRVLAAEHITEEERACLSDHLLANAPKLALCSLVLQNATLPSAPCSCRPPRPQ